MAGAAALLLVAGLAWVFSPALPPPRVVGSVPITNDLFPKQNFVTDGARLYLGETVAGRELLARCQPKAGKPRRSRLRFQTSRSSISHQTTPHFWQAALSPAAKPNCHFGYSPYLRGRPPAG